MSPVPGKTRPCTRLRVRQCKAGKTRVDRESNSRPYGKYMRCQLLGGITDVCCFALRVMLMNQGELDPNSDNEQRIGRYFEVMGSKI
ncbi:hypothetical protein HanHA300_Chr09g0327411 [Helianthus annuus]|nr:hypothetical protein HanHA300_Chr09g0327411 [Helianthus annuus]KAJ0543217.1 hypothetical protein HanHA89_Chr09g0348331 [Helianthus annuus]KAJ0708274.1 hypothetical protein HanLR1_Chr09g0327671 [Helianthus annuus]KAJ0712226.1 hypothetical protein HanOQP8_Chr09g0332521 [Helianthus annuus]